MEEPVTPQVCVFHEFMTLNMSNKASNCSDWVCVRVRIWTLLLCVVKCVQYYFYYGSGWCFGISVTTISCFCKLVEDISFSWFLFLSHLIWPVNGHVPRVFWSSRSGDQLSFLLCMLWTLTPPVISDLTIRTVCVCVCRPQVVVLWVCTHGWAAHITHFLIL